MNTLHHWSSVTITVDITDTQAYLLLMYCKGRTQQYSSFHSLLSFSTIGSDHISFPLLLSYYLSFSYPPPFLFSALPSWVTESLSAPFVYLSESLCPFIMFVDLVFIKRLPSNPYCHLVFVLWPLFFKLTHFYSAI